MNKIIVDIETTGLPKKLALPYDIHSFDSSRMVELGYYIVDNNNKILKQVEYLIQPDNFIIPDEVIKIHGISQEKALAKGKPIKYVLKKLEEDLIKYNCTLFISHNVDFDKKIILSECYRLNLENIILLLESMTDFCTMKDNKIFNKWVKLGLLYKELFNKEIIVEHRALSDVQVCYECYVELIKKDESKYMILRDNKKIRKE